jgi:colicin import membrane protein
MAEFIRKHWAYLIAALLLHVLFAGVFGLTMLRMSRNAPPPQLAIQAVVVDQSLLSRANRQQQRERERRREQAIQREREQAAEQQRREQEETARREAEQRAEQERQVELKQREEADQKRLLDEQQVRERQEAERKREAEAERERKAEAERQRVAEIERKQKEAEQKRRAAEEAEAQQARQEELKRQLDEEEGLMQAENAGSSSYAAQIQRHIERKWNRPASARPGLECEIKVVQAPGGTVLSVQFGACNGDAAVRTSIENAVMRSSPLPPPPDPRLFERNLVLVFKPLE